MKRTVPAATKRPAIHRLENRAYLSFTPPAMPVSPTNPVQVVKAIVLNFEPTAPSMDNQTIWQIFHWNDPRQLAQGFISDLEAASGGAVDFQIVEWRDLNEFPIFTDGFRYTADEYVQNRQTNTGWHDLAIGADFYAIAEQQGLADLVNSNAIDEIWMFGDHYFSLLGEAWMAGPGSFFINGPSFPDFGVDRAVAGYGFSYERGVAEMIHNLGHRTENHIGRAYGGWNLQDPVTPWDKFAANTGESNVTSFGVGTCHFPFNGMSHYDYDNTQVVPSYADDFVYNFPDQTYAAVPMGRDAWGDLGVGDFHRGYLDWYFGHVPRADGESIDGRQNNWYKYIYDFNSYLPDTGLPRDDQAILGAAPLKEAGAATYEFTLRYYDLQGIDISTLGGADVIVTGPAGVEAPATLVSIGPAQPTTVGTARTVTYSIAAPGGTWGAGDAGAYSISLRAGEVKDLAGNFLPAHALGSARIEIAPSGLIGVGAMLATGQASVTGTPSDIGSFNDIFDGDTATLYRTPNIDPAVVTVTFDAPQTLHGFRAMFAGAWGDPAMEWTVETADSLEDLTSHTGSYQRAVPVTPTRSDEFSTVLLPAAITARIVQLTATRLTGDDYVHIREWQMIGPAVIDASPPTASLGSSPEPALRERTSSFVVEYADDVAIEIETVNFGDVRVTGPNGFVQHAALYGLDANSDGAYRDVSWFITAPGGTWDGSDNGTYTISVIDGAVRDTSGRPMAGTILGTFAVAFPPPQTRPPSEMTEQNSADWVAWAEGATASISDHYTRKLLGETSVCFDTTGGFDTYLRYEPLVGSDWDLGAASQFAFSIYAENIHSFQESPIIRLIDRDGDYYEYRYYRDGELHVLWNDAIGQWLAVQIPITSVAAPDTGWRRSSSGTPDWSHIRAVEIHADTWDSGFTLWLDEMGFDLPVLVAASSYDYLAAPPVMTLVFDIDIGSTLTSGDLVLKDIGTGWTVPAGQLSVDYDPATRTARIAYTGGPMPALPDGNYLLRLPNGAVNDVLGNVNDAAHELGFFTLAGDANRDRAVDITDLGILATNWQGDARTFSQGDFNYDGVVDITDLGMLATNWQKGLPQPAIYLAHATKTFGKDQLDRPLERIGLA